ncbi:MAG: 50S ribosomal protein L5 [Candidatus Blackburnbacteria bacterium]|nr:50S ribosomal protein L5 [Candidatus Blackburnbacteria bacterium]
MALSTDYTNLSSAYQKKIVPKLAQELGLKSPMAAPKVIKVVINMGIGNILDSKEEQERVSGDLARITGQKPSLRPARRSVASFGIRRGQHVGLSATLRGRRMYDFLEKLFNIVLPRLRDFKGLPKKSFDHSGNYTLGIAEHTVFPEIDLGKVGKVRGLEITIVTNTRNKEHAARLLEELGMPLEKE